MMNRPVYGRENELELEGMMANWAPLSSDLMRPPVTVKFANFPPRVLSSLIIVYSNPLVTHMATIPRV